MLQKIRKYVKIYNRHLADLAYKILLFINIYFKNEKNIEETFARFGIQNCDQRAIIEEKHCKLLKKI